MNKTLIQKFLLANLDVVSAEVLPLIEPDYARTAATEVMERLKETVVALLDENTDDAKQLLDTWKSLTTDPEILKALKDALTDLISTVEDGAFKDGLTLLIVPVTNTLSAFTDETKPNDEQIKTIWLEFLKSPELLSYLLVNAENLIKLIIKNDNLQKFLINLLKVFGKQ